MKQIVVRDENWNVVYIFDNIPDKDVECLVKSIIGEPKRRKLGEPGNKRKFAVEILE